MDVKHLRTFVVLAEELHFGRTALRLHTAQPVVSKRLKEMEDELGVTLVERSARKIALTRAGRAFLASARQSIFHLDSAVRAAQSGEQDGVERLVLGLMVGAALPRLGAVIAGFRTLNPLADVELTQVTERNLSSELSSGRVDAAVCWDASVPSGLSTMPVATTPLKVLLPSGHPLEAHDPLTPSLLKGHGVIMPGRFDQPVVWERYRQLCEAQGFEPLVLMKVSTTADLLAMVAGGVGIGLSPVPEGLHYPGISIRNQSPAYDLQYVLTWTTMSPAVKALVRFVGQPAPGNADHRAATGRVAAD